MEPEPFINYEEEEAKGSHKTYSHAVTAQIWRKGVLKKHGALGTWGIKHTVLLNKLMEEYNSEDLIDMMEYWIENRTFVEANDFAYFYSERQNVFTALKDWSWES